MFLEQEKQLDLNDDTPSHLKDECPIFFQEVLTWKMYKAKKDAVRIPALLRDGSKKSCGRCGCN